MRNLCVLLGILLFSQVWSAETKKAEDSKSQAAISQTAIPQVAGVWTDAPAATIQNAYMIISQTKTKLKMVHHILWNGKPFVEEGQGTINAQGEIEWKVIVTTQISGWATAGTHKLKFDPKKGTLEGTYHDNKGNKGPLVFHALKAK